MDKRLLELAVEMVQTQASVNKMSGEEIEAALIQVYNALNRIQEAEREGRPIVIGERLAEGMLTGMPAGRVSDPRASIMEDKVVCLECGSEFRQLTANHLKSHGLTPREYKRKYGFPLKQPLAAKVLTRYRSKSAKKRGLPPNLQEYLAGQRQKKGIDAAVPLDEGQAKRAGRGRPV